MVEKWTLKLVVPPEDVTVGVFLQVAFFAIYFFFDSWKTFSLKVLADPDVIFKTSSPTLYRNIDLPLYRISSESFIPVRIDISIY